MIYRVVLTVALGAGICLSSMSVRANGDTVQRCQELEEDFDFEAVLRECSASASDTRLPLAERKIFLRLLGIAHASLGDEEKAKLWFQQLLMLEPEFMMSDGQSPRLLATFGEAQADFMKEGFIEITHVPPASPKKGQEISTKLSFLLDDKLSQIVRGELTLKLKHEDAEPVEAEPVPLVKGQKDADGRTHWVANLPAPQAMLHESETVSVTYEVRIFHEGDGELINRTEQAPHTLLFEAEDAESNLLVPVVVGVSVAGIALAAAGAAGVFAFWCSQESTCSSPVPEVGTVRVGIPVAAGVVP